MAEPTDQMAPEASPGEVTRKSGVRRVNNVPLFIIGAAVMMFVLVMMLVAANRAEQQNAPAEAKVETAGNSTMFAKEVAGEQVAGIIPPAVDGPFRPAAAGAAVPIVTPDGTDLESPPMPPMRDAVPEMPPGSQQARGTDQDAERIRMMRLQQAEEAIKASTSVQISDLRQRSSAQSGSAPTTREDALARISAVQKQIDSVGKEDPTAAYQARIKQLQSSGLLSTAALASGGGAAGSSLSQGAAARPARNDIQQFAGTGEGDRWRLNSEIHAPRSAYELRAGFVIPAILISGINSELPGQIVAQVSQDVFDTPTGQHILVPQGARLVGSYSSDVAYGQSRVLVAWQRIVFPDGKAFDLGSMPGGDASGYAGFKDKVNNHYFRLFGSAFLMSAVTAGVSLSQDKDSDTTGNSNNRQRASDAMSEALGQQLGQVTAQLISKNLNIAPTLEVRPGFRFNVIVVKDLTFNAPYVAFDYN